MLSKEDNELLCRVGPGTPMGELMRQYWIPAARSDELPAPDAPPLRVRRERLRSPPAGGGSGERCS
jgi:phthalate 4,5-dioxygenase